ncbi:unnamed protein product, partial [Symbiodinium sp. CCMP2456]
DGNVNFPVGWVPPEEKPPGDEDEEAVEDSPAEEAGPGIKFQGDPGPEIHLDLYQSLSDLAQATDQQIYDLVEANVAPLPVLRQTLEVWRAQATLEELASACADVLLVLHPEHLCDKVAGKASEDGDETLPDDFFHPDITPPCFAPACELRSLSVTSWPVLSRLPLDFASLSRHRLPQFRPFLPHVLALSTCFVELGSGSRGFYAFQDALSNMPFPAYQYDWFSRLGHMT